MYVALLAIVSSAEGLSFVVDDDNGTWADYGSITEAINHAPEFNTIYIYNGTYNEEFNCPYTFTFIGNGSDVTTVDADEADDVMVLQAPWINVSGLKLMGPGSGDSYLGINDENVTVEDCDFGDPTDNIGKAFRMWRNSNVTIRNCSWSLMRWGVLLRECNDTLFENCNFSSSAYGMLIDTSWRITIRDCEFYNNSFGLNITDGSYDIVVENSTFLANDGNVIVEEDSHDVLIGNCTVKRSDKHGILVNWSNEVDVIGCTISDNGDHSKGDEIRIQWADDCRIIDNDIDIGYNYGILLSYCDDSEVRGNTITGGGPGIRISTSHLCIIEDNWVHNISSGRGLHLLDSNHTDIHKNVFLDNHGNEIIEIVYCYDVNITFNNISRDTDATGISFSNTDNVTVFNNTISWTEIGIYSTDCDYLEIAYNELLNNTYWGVTLSSRTTNSLVHHNNFYGNYNNDEQAYDSQTNDWDNGTEGNWWSDWDGNGTYEIGGSSLAEDNYPLGSPVVTSAPERVPEVGLLLTVAALTFIAIVIRRRRK